MAINITKLGTPPVERVYETRCNRCKTEFTFQAADARKVFDQRDGDYWEVGCPVCGHTVTKSVK